MKTMPGISRSASRWVLSAAVLFSGRPLFAYDWLQFCGSSQHNCLNTQETTLNLDNVKGLKRIFSVPLDNAIDAQPGFLSGVTTDKGVKDLLFVLTSQAQIIAMDAYTGATVWSKKFPGTTYLVTGPVIDPDRQFVYVYGLDGFVHKLKVTDGTEITGGGWPELSTTQKNMRGYTLSQVTTMDGSKYLYSNVTAYINSPGSVTAINMVTGTQHVFNGVCSEYDGHFGAAGAPNCGDGGGGLSWTRSGTVYVPDLDQIFLGFGNDGGQGYNVTRHNWSGTVIALRPDGTTDKGLPLGHYAGPGGECFPTAPNVLPTLPGCKYKHLALQAGKSPELRFINLENLSNQTDPWAKAGNIGPRKNMPQGGLTYAQSVIWTNPADNTVWAFTGTENGMAATVVGVDADGLPTLTSKWSHSTSFTTTPLIANGVLYATDGGGQARFWAGDDHGVRKIYAMNPVTGATLWSDTIDFHHWSNPMVVNGVLYIGDGKTGEGGASQANKGTMKAYSLTADHPISTLRSVGIAGFTYRARPGMIRLTLPMRLPAELTLSSLTGKTLLQRSLQGAAQYEVPLRADIHGALILRVMQGQRESVQRLHLD